MDINKLLKLKVPHIFLKWRKKDFLEKYISYLTRLQILYNLESQLLKNMPKSELLLKFSYLEKLIELKRYCQILKGFKWILK